MFDVHCMRGLLPTLPNYTHLNIHKNEIISLFIVFQKLLGIYIFYFVIKLYWNVHILKFKCNEGYLINFKRIQ